MKQINLLKLLKILGYDDKVLRSIRSRYWQLTFNNDENKDLASKTEAIKILKTIGDGRTKAKEKAKVLSKQIQNDLDLYLSIENRIDIIEKRYTKADILREMEEIKTENASLKKQLEDIRRDYGISKIR